MYHRRADVVGLREIGPSIQNLAMPSVMLHYLQRGASVSKAELQQLITEAGLTVRDEWFRGTEAQGRGGPPLPAEPALILIGLRAGDLGWHAAQGAAGAVGVLGVAWMRNVLNKIRHHPDRAVADGQVELIVSVGEHRSITFVFPSEAEADAARALDCVRLPPWPAGPFHWQARWDATRHIWTLDLWSIEPGGK
jgi:hypothetical protein